ncbi:MAG: AEC family transporter [Clostridia bacterium]|nr:AEC family transporter [Clostridia bacterium]
MTQLFFSYMGEAAKQVAILYVIVAAGFVADKTKIFTAEAAKLTNNLMFYLVTPTVIINSFLSVEATKDNIREFFTALLFEFAVFAVAILITLPILNSKKDPDNPVYKFAAIYGNMGYMALPLARAILGDHGVFLCSAGVVAYNIIAFIHGSWLMQGGGKSSFRLRSLIINPGIIAVAIGMPLFLFHVKLPWALSVPIGYISALNTPVAMLMLGAYISAAGLKGLFSRKKQYISALFKSLLLPAAMLGVFRLAGLSGDLLTAVTISASAPSATNTVLFATRYGRDPGAASKAVAFDCMLSIFTMPLFIALSRL